MAQSKELQNNITLYWWDEPDLRAIVADVLRDRTSDKLPILVTNQPLEDVSASLDGGGVDRFVVISTHYYAVAVQLRRGFSFTTDRAWQPKTKGDIAEAIRIMTGWDYTQEFIIAANKEVFDKMAVGNGPSKLTFTVCNELKKINLHLTDP